MRNEQYRWRDLGDGNPVRVYACELCGAFPSAVDDCGFPNPDCPYFGIGREEHNRRKNKKNEQDSE